MRTLLYRFDGADRFPVIGADTTARRFRVESGSPRSSSPRPPRGEPGGLLVRIERDREDVAAPAIALALPPLAISGRGELILAVSVTAGACRLAIDAADAAGQWVRFGFGDCGQGQAHERELCSAVSPEPDPHAPAGSDNNDAGPLISPYLLYRLVVELPAGQPAAALALTALYVAGDAVVVPAGVAV